MMTNSNNIVIDRYERNVIKSIYICVYLFISGLFIKLLYPQIVKSFFEGDLLWFIPTIIRKTEGLSCIKLIAYLLRLSQSHLWVDAPVLKVYALSVLSLFGALAKNFIFVSILFHFCCSILLFLVSKKLDLNSRISFFAALMYLTLFAHFHAYMWPIAFQHIILVFFILLGLNFYFKTDRLINNGGNYRLLFILTLLINLTASFCRYSILLLPAMIITHILFCSKDNEDRIRKYDIWLPLFIIYLVYPLIMLVAGDIRFKAQIYPLIRLIKPVTDNPAFPMFIYKINIPAKFSILFLLGLSFLFIFRAMLVIYQRYNLRKVLKWTLITVVIVVTLLLIKLGGPKRLLIPYNIIVPFVGILMSFLHPLQNTLFIDSTRTFPFIPFQLDVFNFLSGLSIMVIFLNRFILRHNKRHNKLIILLTWYLINMVSLYLQNPVPSRYLIFLSPIFCIVFSAVLDYIYTCLTNQTKLKIITKEVILALIFFSLCIPNLLAIKLALFKGKMANTFSTYDHIRTADAIRRDLIKSDSIKEIRRKKIYVDNIIPTTFPPIEDFSDPRNDNVRFIFMQVFNDTSINIALNQILPNNESYITYSLSPDGYRINNAEGVNVSVFSQLFEAAQEQLRINNYTKAIDLFGKAIEERPYLFNYILSNLELEDLEWITNGSDMRTWVNKIVCYPNLDCSKAEVARFKYISNIMDRETDEYIQCLFYMSFLKYISGDAKASKYWFSKIRFLENDYQRLYSWLTQIPLVKSDKRILSFLDSFDSTSLYVRAGNYRDRYKFEKFLFEIAFN